MDRTSIILVGLTQRDYARKVINLAPVDYVVEIKPPSRSTQQNAKLWPMLSDVSKQVDWYGRKLKNHEWKDVFTASLKKQEAVPGIDGGFVILGQRTSIMSKRLFSDLVELIYAFGAEKGVIWSEPVRE